MGQAISGTRNRSASTADTPSSSDGQLPDEQYRTATASQSSQQQDDRERTAADAGQTQYMLDGTIRPRDDPLHDDVRHDSPNSGQSAIAPSGDPSSSHPSSSSSSSSTSSRPRFSRLPSKASASSGSTIKARTFSRSSSSKSVATITSPLSPTAAASVPVPEADEEDASTTQSSEVASMVSSSSSSSTSPPKRRSLMQRLTSRRRLSSLSMTSSNPTKKRLDSQGQPVYDGHLDPSSSGPAQASTSNEAAATPLASTSQLTSAGELQQNITDSDAISAIDQPFLPPTTPPEERDPLLLERRRARELIEAALSQARSELSRSASSASMAPPTPSNVTIRSPNEDDALDPPAFVVPIQATPSSSSPVDEQGMQADPAYPSPRLFAPLPRRISRSPSPNPSPRATASDAAWPFPSHAADALSALNDAPAASSQQHHPTGLASAPLAGTGRGPGTPQPSIASPLSIPRRILIQGIVARSPPPSPNARAIHRGTTEASSTPNPTPPPSLAPPTAAINTEPLGNVPEASRVDASRPAVTEQSATTAAAAGTTRTDTTDPSWDDAVQELLSIAPQDRTNQPNTAAAERAQPDDDDDEASAIAQQAALIGRLLSVAAAATAATLLPNTITVNGAPVQGMNGEGGLATSLSGVMSSNPGLMGAGPPPARPRRSSMGSVRAPTESVATSSAPSPRPARSSSNSLQDILRNALAAAFRSPASSPTTENARPLDSLDTSSTAASIPLPPSPAESHRSSPLSNISSPLLSSLNARPASRLPSHPPHQGTALAIPIAALQAEREDAPSTTHQPGSFEHFLSELQSDVTTAIIRSQDPPGQPNAAAVPPSAVTGSSTTTTTTASTDITETGDANEGQNPPPTPPVHPAVIPLDTHPESRSRTPQTGTPLDGNRPFTFFRSFRFPSRSLANVLLSSIDPAIASSLAPSGGFSGPRPATTSAPPAEPAAAAASTTTTDQSQSPHPEVVVGAAANSPATPSNPSPGAVPAGQNSSVPTRSDIVPMLLVGVRSVSALIVHHQGAPSEATPSSTAADANASAGASQVPSNVDDDGDVQMADASQGVPSLPTSHPASGENEPMSAPRSSFVLWIMGGLYPSNHPIVLAPSLLGDDNLTYEDMLRLAEVMGQHKPPTVSADEIKQSNLELIKGRQVTEYRCADRVREITAERCLVCLEDYEPDEDLRILNCKHCFHQQCVDRWLSTGSNTCPACRTEGVKKQQQQETPAEPVSAI